jgi:predicted ATP-binding protein involved in virulence
MSEIGALLHPTWRMRVVGGLRRMVPGMQFVVSTHEPIYLRGIEEHETVLMQRDDRDSAFATTDLPSPRDLRVDQLLTSRHFGLDTTLDPELNAQFDEYYQLLGHPETALTADQRARRA